MEFVTIAKQTGITLITMNRPALHNAFNDQMIAELTGAFDDAAQDSSCRVVVLQAEGKNFSAGADLNWMKGMAALSQQENRDDAGRLAALMHRVYTMPKLVIAKVQGASYGGALGLVSACDIAVGATNASFCLSEVKIGLAPAVISPYVIEAIGIRQSRRYMLSAEVFKAETAQAMGLLHEVVAPEELSERVMALADLAAQNGPNAVSGCKQLIHAISRQSIGESTMDTTANLIAELRVSEEGQEGLAAFLEKRTPAWRTSGEEI